MDAAFDTLSYAKRLREAGFTEAQAEAQISILVEIIDEKLATKRDIAELRRDIAEFKAEIQRDLKELEMRMTLKLGTIAAVAVGVVATLVKVL